MLCVPLKGSPLKKISAFAPRTRYPETFVVLALKVAENTTKKLHGTGQRAENYPK